MRVSRRRDDLWTGGPRRALKKRRVYRRQVCRWRGVRLKRVCRWMAAAKRICRRRADRRMDGARRDGQDEFRLRVLHLRVFL